MTFPIEKFKKAETPFYYYDLALLQRTINEVKENARDFKVHYAIKANANPVILNRMAINGFGADCVSGGEVQAAIDAGIAPHNIVFAGVGKTDAEISLALQHGIGCFNSESIPELEAINEVASKLNKVAQIAIRVNPDIDAHTHHYITTGLAENKFGISMEQLPEVISLAKRMKNIEVIGFHFHIGSQILDFEPYEALCSRINELQDKYSSELNLRMINVGGGLGINYNDPDFEPIPDFKEYFAIFRKNLKLRPGQTLHFELGRSIVAQCGSLISRVTYVKQGVNKTFVIIDAGMSELLRPALYGAHHRIENLTASSSSPMCTYDVVGPVCESSDVFASEEQMPLTKRGDIIALRSAGAYGETMASNYNLRKLNQPIFS